jgi:vacuolar-type H+-ATPase subunit C/Vma6
LVKLLGLDKWTKAYSKMNKAYSDMIFEKTMAKLERYRFLAFSSMFVITGFFLSYVNREVKDLKEIVRGKLTFNHDLSVIFRRIDDF